MGRAMTAGQALARRMHAQQLDREPRSATDAAVLDVGVQDTGPDGARWALALRGVEGLPDEELVLAWTIRGAPHVYRRADLAAVARATSPFSEADAAKRVHDSARPLAAAGIPVVEALDALAATMRDVAREPTVKGDMSAALTARMPAPYLRDCRPCGATHVHEMPFRLAALRAGLELDPGTSPPVLRRVPDFAPAEDVPPRLDVVRGYLRLLGPATPAHVAGYLEAPTAEVKARWPADAEEVLVDGERRWELPDADAGEADPGTVRLLGPFDLFLQARDRTTLVPDRARAKELWPVIGRPGAVLVGGRITGSWRARRAGKGVTIAVHAWTAVDRPALDDQAERLAAFRGLPLSSLSVES
jgi:Winged helix DNA-binding domain